MSDLGNVLGFYEMAEQAFERGMYNEAAIYFRQCYLTYETGELTIYLEDVHLKGTNALNRYKDILNNYLTQAEREKLQKEDDAFGGLEEQFGN